MSMEMPVSNIKRPKRPKPVGLVRFPSIHKGFPLPYYDVTSLLMLLLERPLISALGPGLCGPVFTKSKRVVGNQQKGRTGVK